MSIEKLKNIASNLVKFSGGVEPIVIDGKRVGAGVGSSRNLENKTKVHKTAKEAIVHEQFVKSKTEQGLDVAGLNNEERDELVQKVVSKYIEEFVRRDLFNSES